MIATPGKPRDVTVEEIRIKFFFPMDQPTAPALSISKRLIRHARHGQSKATLSEHPSGVL